QRSLRGKNMTRSLLEEIPGIGEKRRNALLLRFGSIDRIREATRDELAETPGMTEGAADSVLAFFRDRPVH
ncbi:MAG: excinuclease ABC subunit C, partial [Firmicutes bacterium]|nr:excinuclease ABC subunit C [Bacillota bacterium]